MVEFGWPGLEEVFFDFDTQWCSCVDRVGNVPLRSTGAVAFRDTGCRLPLCHRWAVAATVLVLSAVCCEAKWTTNDALSATSSVDSGDWVHVSPHGVDSPFCGIQASPCGTISYAIVVRASGVQPLTAMAVVAVAAGRFDRRSCGARIARPLLVVGEGSNVTVVDCELAARFLATTSSISVSGIAVMHGFAEIVPIATAASAGGGAVSVEWSDPIALFASFVDVRAEGCVVNASAVLPADDDDGGSVSGEAGGGAVSVSVTVDARASHVTFHACQFTNNSLLSQTALGLGSAVLVTMPVVGAVNNVTVCVDNTSFVNNYGLGMLLVCICCAVAAAKGSTTSILFILSLWVQHDHY